MGLFETKSMVNVGPVSHATELNVGESNPDANLVSNRFKCYSSEIDQMPIISLVTCVQLCVYVRTINMLSGRQLGISIP